MRVRPLLIPLFLIALAGKTALDANTLTSDQAKNHIGETRPFAVSSRVLITHAESRGNPTFVNLDKQYPNQIFTIVIWDEDLAKFSPKPSTWEGKRVCATGVIFLISRVA